MNTEARPSAEMKEKGRATPTAERVLTIARVFDAPPGLIFKAWTNPSELRRWWGPKGFTTPFCKIDLRPGGVFHYSMRSPEVRDYWGKGIYREIVEPERLVYTDFFADEEGKAVPATQYGLSPDWPAEMLVKLTFAAHEDKTKLTLEHVGVPLGAEGDSCEVGWNESLDRLAEHLAKVLNNAQTPSGRAARAA